VTDFFYNPDMIPQSESLKVELKSDRKRLSGADQKNQRTLQVHRTLSAALSAAYMVSI
jgi:hypothetical protein